MKDNNNNPLHWIPVMLLLIVVSVILVNHGPIEHTTGVKSLETPEASGAE